MDEVTGLRLLSAVSVILWSGVVAFTVPHLVRAHPKEHPIIFLLMAVVIVELVQAVAFFDTALTATGMRQLRGQIDVYILRCTSILAAVVFGVVMARLTRSDRDA